MPTNPPPRLLPEATFPDYSYVPGLWPHPHTLSNNPLFPEIELPVNLDPWQECRPYLLGIDLWNHGYYWEAHEAWEALWHAAGRKGPVADFFKGLIQLAVAGVKVRQGMEAAAMSHARRGRALLDLVHSQLGKRFFFGLDLQELDALASDIEATCPPDPERPPVRVKVVFNRFLQVTLSQGPPRDLIS